MFIIYTNNVVNEHLHLYFGPSASLILFLKLISGRMNSINILESLGTICLHWQVSGSPLPKEKMIVISQCLTLWHAGLGHFTAKEAASLQGKLIHMSCIFPLIQPFLHPLSYFASFLLSYRARWAPLPHVRADLSKVSFILDHALDWVPLAPL